jgi:hypothetical protein
VGAAGGQHPGGGQGGVWPRRRANVAAGRAGQARPVHVGVEGGSGGVGSVLRAGRGRRDRGQVDGRRAEPPLR